MERILLYQDALAEVLRHAAALPTPTGREVLDLLEAGNRVLAQPITADRDQPPFARSTRDGFAVHSADLAQGNARLRIIGSLAAGALWSAPAPAPGEALEIMTGAPVPDGPDAVLIVEHAQREGDQLLPAPERRLRPGENIVTAGAEARAGDELVPAGRRIGTPEISLAASSGYTHLNVYARPTVAIIATGDELVDIASVPAPSQIRNSNSSTLASLVLAEGAKPFLLPPARDTADDLRARLAEARAADLILFSGGVSMGKYDLVEAALLEAGAEFLFTGTRIQPGKPLVFGRLPAPVQHDASHPTQTDAATTNPSSRPERNARSGEIPVLPYPDAPIGKPSSLSSRALPFFGLPGNPISTEVCFRLFVAPLLRALAGQTDLPPRFAEARLAEPVRGGAKVTRFLPAITAGDWGGVTVRPVPWQGSGDLAANGRANSFVVLPLDSPDLAAGSPVRVLLR